MTTTLQDVELLVDARAIVGESPVWDEQRGILYWVDILGRQLHTFDPETRQNHSVGLTDIVGAIVLQQDGGLVAAVENGFAHLDAATGKSEPIALLDTHGPASRMNDGKCDPSGRFLAGTMAYDLTPGAGALYRLEPDGAVRTMVNDVTLSNGLDWSPDGTRFYFIDSLAEGTDVFDVDAPSGELANRRRFVDIPREDGIADGLTVDADGYVWVALYLGGCVRRYAPDGTLDAIVETPVRTPTCPVFGGQDLTDLYITSSAMVMADPSEEPGAGGLFRCATGVPGLPARRIA